MFIDRIHRGRQVTLWINGKSKTRKSSLAQSRAPHCRVKGKFNSDKIHTNCDFITFYELFLEDFKEYKDFMHNDPFKIRSSWNHSREFDLGRSLGKQGIPIVWTTNYDPRRLPPSKHFDINWIIDNTIFIDIRHHNLTKPLPP
jgi:hypothetical protein